MWQLSYWGMVSIWAFLNVIWSTLSWCLWCSSIPALCFLAVAYIIIGLLVYLLIQFLLLLSGILLIDFYMVCLTPCIVLAHSTVSFSPDHAATSSHKLWLVPMYSCTVSPSQSHGSIPLAISISPSRELLMVIVIIHKCPHPALLTNLFVLIYIEWCPRRHLRCALVYVSYLASLHSLQSVEWVVYTTIKMSSCSSSCFLCSGGMSLLGLLH